MLERPPRVLQAAVAVGVATVLVACGAGSGPHAVGASAVTTSPTPAGLDGADFWVDPDNDARRSLASEDWDEAGRAALTTLADTPGAVWLTDGQRPDDARVRAQQVTEAAATAGQVPVLVLYALPDRDCGGHSAGGAESGDAYRTWVRAVARGIGERRAVVVVEPDALALQDCLSDDERDERQSLLRIAVEALSATGATTYLDAGHSDWVDAPTMATRLEAAGVELARGFALNVSNFRRTADEETYGERLSSLLGGKAYVVDTSRNGNGPASGPEAWCNPGGRSVGTAPTTETDARHADAYLWVKVVGQSDGGCGRDEPVAGTWWPEYAIGLVRGDS